MEVVFYYTTYTKASIDRRDGIVFYFAYGTEVILDVTARSNHSCDE